MTPFPHRTPVIAALIVAALTLPTLATSEAVPEVLEDGSLWRTERVSKLVDREVFGGFKHLFVNEAGEVFHVDETYRPDGTGTSEHGAISVFKRDALGIWSVTDVFPFDGRISFALPRAAAMTADGTIHILVDYYTGSADPFALAYHVQLHPNGSIETNRFPTNPNEGVAGHMAIDPNGQVALVWQHAAKTTYSTFDGQTWTSTLIVNGYLPNIIGLVYDSHDKPHLAAGNKLYTTNTAGAWIIEETYSPNFILGGDIAIASDDTLHLVRQEWEQKPILLRTRHPNGTWTNTYLPSTTQSDDLFIALDSHDNPHITYYSNPYGNGTGYRRYLHQHTNGQWQDHAITLMSLSAHPFSDAAMTIGPDDRLHLTYTIYEDIDPGQPLANTANTLGYATMLRPQLNALEPPSPLL